MSHSYFFYRLLPPRPDFPFTLTPHEAEVMRDHSVYWDQELAQDHAVALGPVQGAEGAFGIGILKAETLDQARALVLADPALTRGIGFQYELAPMLALKQRAETMR